MFSLIETRLFINNEFVSAKSGSTFALYNPTTEEHVADISQAEAADIEDAFIAATAAQKRWENIPAMMKSPLYGKLAGLIMQNGDELARLEAISMGKPYSSFMFDKMACAGLFGHYANAAYHIQGQSSLNTPGMVNMTIKQPYGVVAAIIPWNVSLIMFAMKCIKLGALIKQAGFPPGLINIVSGYGHITGKVLAEHMKIRKIAFTGSVPTGKKIMQMAAASNLKNVTLELGGKSPAIIFADADLDMAAKATEFSIHQNSGQHCQANSRSRKIGDPLEKDTWQGPQGDKLQQKRVLSLIENGKKNGELVLGGKAANVGGKGYFVEPTIFKNVNVDAGIYKEEIFGPVLLVNTFTTEEDVICRANDTEYGLFASVYTSNFERAMRFAKLLESGAVGINCSAPTQTCRLEAGSYLAIGNIATVSGLWKEDHDEGQVYPGQKRSKLEKPVTPPRFCEVSSN
ncbi:aldehyde dehydrogenase [Acephala macrosclerotiorum]|nr:aldehyde dehydrogenase [Acephala macrosclerotiorum]